MLSSTIFSLLLTIQTLAAASDTSLQIPYEKYTIPSNGLEIILSEDHTLPVVAVNVWYHAGPINEAPQRTGFAHLFEHLMFQGSQHIGDDQHFKRLEASGASSINGTTSYDRTNYFETVPANELELALWLESDRMGFLLETLTQAKLDNQREVVMNERRQSMDNAPYGRTYEALVQNLLPKEHPYFGCVMGSMQDLSSATLQDVRDFYTRYYAPSNATLVIAGDFDPQTARKLVDRYFASLKHRDAPLAHAITTPALHAEKRQTLRDNVSLARIDMAWLSPPAYQPGDADADILAYILGGGQSSRLYQHLVYEKQLAQDISADQESHALTSIFSISATARPDVSIEQIEREIEHVLHTIRTKPVQEHEIMRARNQYKTQLVSQLQSLGGFGGKADMLNRYNQYVHNPGYFSEDLQRYDAVTAKSIQAMAQNILNPNARSVVITLPVAP